MSDQYQRTIYACFVGYIVQAIVNNFVPLLFLTFQNSYGIPLSQITLLVTLNFGLQLLVDLASVGFVDRIGYRACLVLAHGLAAAGLALLAVLPELLPNPFIGILLAVMVYAVGGGLLEVLVSPVVEACPSEHKEQAMSLLHSFYCWGHVGVVLVSTVFFALFGVEHWRVLALAWALVPLCNLFACLKAPIAPLMEEGERSMTLGELAGQRVFWVFLLMMLCSGASEQGVSQWASTFAERGLVKPLPGGRDFVPVVPPRLERRLHMACPVSSLVWGLRKARQPGRDGDEFRCGNGLIGPEGAVRISGQGPGPGQLPDRALIPAARGHVGKGGPDRQGGQSQTDGRGRKQGEKSLHLPLSSL